MPAARGRFSRLRRRIRMPTRKPFRLTDVSRKSRARAGFLRTAHGSIPTPAFMTIATRGSVRALELGALPKLGVGLILANTYHLWIRPGLAVIKKARGLHRFMGWGSAILTDSGGYQVFSLSGLRTISDEGVSFRDEVDGTLRLLSPEESMRIQSVLHSDIAMAFDECPSYNASRPVIELAVERTTRWAERCFQAKRPKDQLLFGIVQGANLKDLRIKHARTIAALPFDGYAVGGVAMGERVQMEDQDINRVLDWVVPELPVESPHYLMGVGPPDQIVDAVKRGIDMFDCVLPTRNARHELLYIWEPKAPVTARQFWSTLKINRAECADDLRPIDPTCDCPTCRTTTRAYVRHLFATGDPLAARFATIHNVRFYQRLMEAIRKAIRAGKL
jgi:queuine tRNA-ribosyltransferase